MLITRPIKTHDLNYPLNGMQDTTINQYCSDLIEYVHKNNERPSVKDRRIPLSSTMPRVFIEVFIFCDLEEGILGRLRRFLGNARRFESSTLKKKKRTIARFTHCEELLNILARVK
ncbi:hypothetical protein CEXT_523971 [Caerostris extrusa]|uniref:LAGLIDADG homing endonuclease n=1 Tax=Caerostris extrusa TaxID=172846 RepID=A0AAV4NC30_CAEEX|nr:hypothetical protein CEXT_523971 [Caerostris extrusa]